MSVQFDNYSRLVGQVEGYKTERARILSLIDHLIHDIEDCPLYEGEEREWLLSAYWNVRRVVKSE